MTNDPHSFSLNQENTPTTMGQIKRWYDAAIPSPASRDVRKQLALHFKEVSEMLDLLGSPGTGTPPHEQRLPKPTILDFAQQHLRHADSDALASDVDRIALLKVLCEQIVSAIGVAHLMGMDIEAAVESIASTNIDLLREDGQPTFTVAIGFSQRPTLGRADLARFVTMPLKQS